MYVCQELANFGCFRKEGNSPHPLLTHTHRHITVSHNRKNIYLTTHFLVVHGLFWFTPFEHFGPEATNISHMKKKE